MSGFTLTMPEDKVSVDIVDPNGTLNIVVGALPVEIGQKVDSLTVGSRSAVNAILMGKELGDAINMESDKVREAFSLLLRYGLKGVSGIEDKGGNQIPIKFEKDDKDRPVLSDETMDIFLRNEDFLTVVGEKMSVVRNYGLGKYAKHGEEGLKKFLAAAQGQMQNLAQQLQTRSNSSYSQPFGDLTPSRDTSVLESGS